MWEIVWRDYKRAFTWAGASDSVIASALTHLGVTQRTRAPPLVYINTTTRVHARACLLNRVTIYTDTQTRTYIYIYNSNLCIAVTRARPIVEFVASSRMEKLERVGIFYFLQCFINRLLSPSLCLFLPITRALYILIKL